MIKRNSKKGFSLVELIVAICIMAVLMSVLVPSFLSMMNESRFKKDQSKFESMCTYFKQAMTEPEVRRELEDFVEEGETFLIICQVGSDGVITMADSEMRGSLKTSDLGDTTLWLNSYQGITPRYEVDSKESWNKYVVFTLTPKTANTTAACTYEIVDARP